MDGTEKIVEHLKMTQAIINRLANNCVLVKGWSMTIILAAMVLITKHEIQSPYFVPVLLILPVWILDGYFLRQERLFRQVYNEIRVRCDTDFNMDVQKHKNKPKCGRVSTFFSLTLVIFYSVEIAFMVGVFVIIQM